VCLNVAGELRDYVRPRALGRITINDSGVVTEREPDTVRGADVAYFSFERLPKHVTPRVYPDVPPELVFEVMSPDDVFRDVMAKVDEYLAAGVLLVYVIDPSREQAMLFQKDSLGTLFGPTDEMTSPRRAARPANPRRAAVSGRVNVRVRCGHDPPARRRCRPHHPLSSDGGPVED
jgi:Uma2 family endonuclease